MHAVIPEVHLRCIYKTYIYIYIYIYIISINKIDLATISPRNCLIVYRIYCCHYLSSCLCVLVG